MHVTYRHLLRLTAIPLVILASAGGESHIFANEAPVANAGLTRYVAKDTVQLDGSRSYDPDGGPLAYAWTQTSGPPVTITEADTATPTIGGFVQTNAIQECTFELVVNDGELVSRVDVVRVLIVPRFGSNTLRLENDTFDPHKPTIIYFGGGDCMNGLGQYSASPFADPHWLASANIVTFPDGYSRDFAGQGTYYQYGDMILVYLCAVAPDYRQLIQTSGWSTGGQPAIDVGRRLNLIYRDRRYAVNRVTLFDTTPYCRDYSESIRAYLSSSVDGEPCWVDNYVSSSGYSGGPVYPHFYDSVLNVWFETGVGSSPYGSADWWKKHRHAQEWYNESLSQENMRSFNSGVVAGAYWSVIGPGKNLQLASTPGDQTYKFQWLGWSPSGRLGFYNAAVHPGRLPEPVTLRMWHHTSETSGDMEGAVLSCDVSENAVGYELLSGSDPHDVLNYIVVANSNTPPVIPLTMLPPSDTWWTVRVRDVYGSTIHADPVRVDLPLGLIAYWRMDETEGTVAPDSAGWNDATVMGEALWWPEGGAIGGALELGGFPDFVAARFVLNPSRGSFSVFAWIKGGAPGQVILSQDSDANWLMADPAAGALMTELKGAGRDAKPLISASIIADGTWHRVGLVCDGDRRTLYVDDVVVAEDTQWAGPVGGSGGLNIGCGANRELGTFFTGLIDEVRIYNRVVWP